MTDFLGIVRCSLRSAGLRKIHHYSFADLLARKGIRTPYGCSNSTSCFGVLE